MKTRDPEHHAEVVALLSSTPFVVARDGTRRRPAELYDPQQQLFGDVMLPLMGLQQQQQQSGKAHEDGIEPAAMAGAAAALFPAAPFDSPSSWLPVLRECGLVSKADLSTYLQLAQQFAEVAAAIAARSPPPTLLADASRCIDLSGLPQGQAAQLIACGAVLQQHLLQQHYTLLGGTTTAQQRATLSRLAFAPATLGLPGHPSARRVLTCHAHAALSADWALCWAALPLLDSAAPLPGPVASALSLRSPPPLSVVLQHMQQVAAACRASSLLSSWPGQGVGTVEEATAALIAHLESQGLSREQAAVASTAAFLPVASATRLVAPTHAFLRLPLRGGGGGAVGGGAGLAPYAFELPGQLQGGGRSGILQLIGVRDEPNARDLVRFCLVERGAVGGGGGWGSEEGV